MITFVFPENTIDHIGGIKVNHTDSVEYLKRMKVIHSGSVLCETVNLFRISGFISPFVVCSWSEFSDLIEGSVTFKTLNLNEIECFTN